MRRRWIVRRWFNARHRPRDLGPKRCVPGQRRGRPGIPDRHPERDHRRRRDVPVCAGGDRHLLGRGRGAGVGAGRTDPHPPRPGGRVPGRGGPPGDPALPVSPVPGRGRKPGERNPDQRSDPGHAGPNGDRSGCVAGTVRTPDAAAPGGPPPGGRLFQPTVPPTLSYGQKPHETHPGHRGGPHRRGRKAAPVLVGRHPGGCGRGPGFRRRGERPGRGGGRAGRRHPGDRGGRYHQAGGDRSLSAQPLPGAGDRRRFNARPTLYPGAAAGHRRAQGDVHPG